MRGTLWAAETEAEVDPATCSAAARELVEDPAGSAGTALGYVLIEQPGSWGRDALTSSPLDPTLGARLQQRAAEAGVKALLIRRPGPHPRRHRPRTTVLLAHVGTEPWLEVCDLDPAGLADLDPAVVAAPTPPGIGRRSDQPVWLVCTHARRDRCCATLGRPIADTLGALHPAATWETSHLGGHRFAGTMLTLPWGLVYGNLDVARALEVVAAHGAGRLLVDHLRGRSQLSPVLQVAEVAARRALGLDGIAAPSRLDPPVTVPHPDGPALQAVVEFGGRRVQVSVAAVTDRRPRPMSCGGAPETPVTLVPTEVTILG